MRSPITTTDTTVWQSGELSLKLGRITQFLQIAYTATQKDANQQLYRERYLQAIKLGAEFAEEIEDYSKAVYYWEQLTQQLPQSADVWYGLGIAKANLSDYRGAELALNRALQIEPNYQKARSHLAQIQQIIKG